MTFPSLRKLLFVAPLLAAVGVGVAAACSPYIGPLVAPASPGCTGGIPSGSSLPAYQPTTGLPAVPTTAPPTQCPSRPVSRFPPLPAQPRTTAAMPPPVAECPLETHPASRNVFPAGPQPVGTSFSVVGSKIQVQSADGARMLSDKLTIVIADGVDPLEVSIVGQQLRVESGKDTKGGAVLHATAQNLNRTGNYSELITLTGGAKLVYARDGKRIDVTADRLTVNLSAGVVISELAMSRPAVPVIPSPPAGVSDPLAPPPSPDGSVGRPAVPGTAPSPVP